MEKGPYEKLIEEYPESEKEIKNTFGYNLEMIAKARELLFETVIADMDKIVEKIKTSIKKIFRR